MRSVLMAFMMIVFSLSVRADASPAIGRDRPPITLRERVLSVAAADPGARPAGQCIYTCGDRMLKLRRCASGDCPDYDCRTGVVSCPTR